MKTIDLFHLTILLLFEKVSVIIDQSPLSIQGIVTNKKPSQASYQLMNEDKLLTEY